MAQIHELNNAGRPAPGTYFITDNGTDTGRAGFNETGQAFIEDYQGTQLGGQYQSPKSAIDQISTTLGGTVADYQHLYNGLREYSVPEGLFGSSGDTLETNTGEILEARVVLAAGGDVETLQRRAAALETLYQAQVSSTQELRQLAQVQAQAIAALTETLEAAQTQINKLTVHALLDSGWED